MTNVGGGGQAIKPVAGPQLSDLWREAGGVPHGSGGRRTGSRRKDSDKGQALLHVLEEERGEGDHTPLTPLSVPTVPSGGPPLSEEKTQLKKAPPARPHKREAVPEE